MSIKKIVISGTGCALADFLFKVIFSVAISLLSSICINAQSFRVFGVSDLVTK